MYFENVLNNLNVLTRNNLKNLKLPVDRTKYAEPHQLENIAFWLWHNNIPHSFC